MSRPFEFKIMAGCEPAILVDNASLVIEELDTKGFNRCLAILHIGATDIGITAAQITQANVTATSHAAITGSVVGTATDIEGTTTVLLSATDDNKFQCWDIDLRDKMRFLDATVTFGDGTVGGYATFIWILYEPDVTPTTSAGYGCDHLMRF